MIGAVSGPKGEVERLLSRLFSFCGEPHSRVDSPLGVLLGWERSQALGAVVAEATIGGLNVAEVGNTASVAFEHGRLRLGRGSHSAPPLYYARTGEGGWLVLSHFEPIARTLDFHSTNDAWLSSALLSFSFPMVDQTPVREISRVPDRAWVHLEGEARVVGWRTPSIPRQLGEPRALAEGLWNEIRASVARATNGHDRIAVMVGGGVDSSGVLAAAVAESRGASRRDVQAIALDFEGPGSDRPHLEALCRELGVIPIRKSPAEAAPFIAKTFVLDGIPYPNLAGPWFAMMAEEARARGATILLNGENGDAALTGDPRFFSKHLAHGHPFSACARAYRFTKPFPQGKVSNVRDYVFRPLVKRWVPTRLLEHRRRHARFATVGWLGEKARAGLDERQGSTFEMNESSEARYKHLVCPLAGTDYATMRMQLESSAGIPLAEIFCDDQLVRFVAGIDPLDLLYGDQERGLYRLALRGEIPESVRLRTDKAGYLPAIVETIEAAGGVKRFADLATMRIAAQRGLVRAEEFGKEFAKLIARPDLSIHKWGELWPAFSVEAFLRRA